MKIKTVLASASLFTASILPGALLPLRAAPADSNPLLAPRTVAGELQLVVAAPASLNLTRAEAFDQAATDAIDNLYGALIEKNLLPASSAS